MMNIKVNIVNFRDFPESQFEDFAVEYLSEHWKKPKSWIRDTFLTPAKETASFPFLFFALNEDNDFMGMIILFFEEEGYLQIKNQPWITGLYVIPSERKKGIATALIDHAIVEAKIQGFSSLYLDTAQMKDFYLAKDWEIVGTAFWEEGGMDVTVMKTDIQ